ncbi:MAG TPA: peroxiredoxin [Polyangiaceae bacterium]|nr:peroxiredoxin [Polyangiaceae bacterium]
MAAKKRSKVKAGKRTPATSARASERSTKKTKAAARAKAASSKASAPAPAAKKAKKKAASKPAAAKASAASAKAPPAASATLGEGDRAPSFDLSDHAGGSVSSASLSGHPYVLYFYPKDDTPGCTTEACGFRDSFPDFDAAGVRVLGVSPDSVASHQKFVGKYGLPFTLLSDGERSLAAAYGVWALKKLYGRESMGIVRSTFLIDAEGTIRKVWRGVRVNGHVAEVQAAAAQLA